MLEEYIVTPNHMHGIIGITGDSDAMNSVPTDKDYTNESIAGPPIYRGPESVTKGGATKEHNPMLHETHLGKIIRWYTGRCTFEI